MTDRRPDPSGPDGSAMRTSGADGDADVAEAAALVSLLRKAATVVNVFPANSPSYRRCVDELVGRLSEFCRGHGKLELEVGPECFVFEGCEIGREESGRYLGYRLYRDGIREVSFADGVDTAEVLGFLKLVVPRQTEGGTDTVSAILSKEFAHVKFLVSQDIFTEEAMTEQALNEDSAALAGLGFYAPLEDELPRMVETIRGGLPDDIGPLAGDLQPEAATAGVDALALIDDILMAVLESDVWPELKKTTLQRMVTVAGEHFDSGRFTEGLATVERLSLLPPEFQAGLDDEIARLFGDDLFERLIDRLNEADGVVPESIRGLLKFLGRRSLDRLCDLASRVADVTVLKDVIVDAARQRPDDILRRLGRTSDPRLAAVLVGVAESLGDARAVEPLVAILPRQEGWVKTQIVDVLAVLGGSKARAALTDLLEDNESWIRIAAVRALGRIGDVDTLDRLQRTTERSSFQKADDVERQAVWQAVLELADDEAVTIARRVLRRRSLLHRRRVEQAKIDLVTAAGRTSHGALAGFLESEAARRGEDDDLGAACRAAVGAIRRLTSSGRRAG